METNARALRIEHLNVLYPPYWDEGRCIHKSKGRRKKQLMTFKYRESRTWKHNRKTRWKRKN